MRSSRIAVFLLLLGLLAATSRLLAPSCQPGRPVSPPASLVAGQVVDADGPVAGVRVRFKGDRHSILTDDEGRFQLPRRPTGSGRVTAWKNGYLIAGARADSFPLLLTLAPLPREDCERYAWVDPTPGAGRHSCGNCHEEIYREWAASGHARSANGRHFLNLYDGTDWHGRRGAGWSLLDQYADGAGVCTACHAPTVAHNDPAYFDLRKAHGVAALGVHCDYCHKVADAGGGEVGLTHGRFGLKLLRPPLTPTPLPPKGERGRGEGGQLFFGPLDDVDRGEDAFTPLYRQSRYCASCHEGTVFGIHVYSTYSEWLDSPARLEGKHCQSCHMTPTGRMTNIAPGHGGIRREAGTLGNHRFFNGSPKEMLRASLGVSVELSRAANGVRAGVSVTADQVGHRLPTGFIDRHLLLVVEGVGADGKPLRLLDGPVLPSAAGKGLSGQPGRLYGKLLKDLEGRSPAPFWRADPTLSDTRLYPRQPDRSVYTFPAELDHLRVRLFYRRFWQEVAETKQWPDNEITIVDRTIGARAIP